MKEIISKAKSAALKEIEKYNAPSHPNFELSNNKGQELAEKLGADKDIVLLGTILMDIKLGEAMRTNKIKEHVKMSSDFTRKFLEKLEVPVEMRNKIINCVEAHHKTIPYICKEAEICANADCYRFIYPKNVFELIADLTKEGMGFRQVIQLASDKLEEKHDILSIDLCKKELEEYYQMFRKLFDKTLNFSDK